MPRLVWTTDIHFDFITPSARREFLRSIAVQEPDLLVISGDIGEAPTTPSYLDEMAHELDCPIYFVLGNHDYYFSSIAAVRRVMYKMHDEEIGLHYLQASGIVPLGESSVMIGHDGWSDGGYGDFFKSEVMMSDYVHIEELANIGIDKRLKKLRDLSAEAAKYLKSQIEQISSNVEQVYIVTHPVPFRETCQYEGKVAEPDNIYLPHFSSKAIGDVLLDAARHRPQTEFIVLCGHTHEGCDIRMATNLRVIVGQAEYEKPIINGVFDI